MAKQLDGKAANGSTMQSLRTALPTDSLVGEWMSATPAPATRQAALPHSGGLMGRSFTYRTAEKTDVRLTWANAKAGLKKPTTHA